MPSPIPLPKEKKKQVVTFRLLPGVIAKVKKIAGDNKSAWIEQAVIEKLQRAGVKVEDAQSKPEEKGV